MHDGTNLYATGESGRGNKIILKIQFNHTYTQIS